jgi:hypothetical protein
MNLMDDALRRFHNFKLVFLQYWAHKKTTEQSKELQKELNKEQDADMDKYRNCSANERKRQLDDWNDWIKSEVVDYLEEESSFNLPKLHLMTHFRRYIERFGGLQQWSTEVGEAAHKTQIKDGYQASNKTGDVYRQIVKDYLHRDAFAVPQMNLNANGFSNVASRPTKLDVSYLTAATGGSSAEGSGIK